ncbi:hypothetical protein [Rhizobium sp. MHM7A]|uniref:hypothetical protein n=1 Tax=Rhizobium sp. MHM7A TaxID=2583233 RepID=UPI0011063C35|nr:hypothetical protein [Rhizobium sp. MHM7A]TLX16963.1 hypothetical protein FFR93_06465 [Rhizobium sp. MHM7A]
MNGIIGSFLAISDTEAKVTILGKDGSRREAPIPLEKARELVNKLKAKGISGEFPRSSKPKINVRERMAAL